MFILIQGWCAVTSAYRRFFVYLDREWSSGLFLLSSVARDGSSERWGHEPRIHFVICTSRAWSEGKVRLLVVHFLLLLLVFSLLFYLRVKEIYISFLDFLERNSIGPLAFPVGFLGVEPLGVQWIRSLHRFFISSNGKTARGRPG